MTGAFGADSFRNALGFVFSVRAPENSPALKGVLPKVRVSGFGLERGSVRAKERKVKISFRPVARKVICDWLA